MQKDTTSLTADEAAAYLGVSRATLYAYVSRGLVASEPGDDPARRARRYPRASLDRLKAQRAERRDPASGALRWGAPVLESALTLIRDGRLFYRGRDACELSRTATLEEVAALLWTGDAAGAAELFPPAAERPEDAGPFADRLVARLVEERAASPLSLDGAGPAALRAAGRTVSGLFDALGATGGGDLAERLARGWRSQHVDELRAALVLCADHELNASAFTARCVASTDAPIGNALLAALCALEGRRHGGASRAAEDLLDDAERRGAEQACRRAVARTGWLPAFGHPLYPDGDPRAREILDRLHLPESDYVARVVAFGRELGSFPSLDFALAALSHCAAWPADAPFAVFALGRSVGWVAHAFEAAETGALIRPRARYVGVAPR
ncbi:MAG TPA: citrate synthase family protein [Gaiellaceae bacterium]|jgi:citrate synthase